MAIISPIDHRTPDEAPGRARRDVSALLRAWNDGDQAALAELTPIVYDELRRLAHRYMKRERAGQSLQTTALVNEAYLRLVDQKRARVENRAHFFSLAAQAMRRVLVDEARRRRAAKRGSGQRTLALEDVAEPRVAPDADLLALDEALDRLQGFDPHLSRLVELRHFGGLTLEEAGQVLGISTTSAWRDWNTARAWLFDALSAGS